MYFRPKLDKEQESTWKSLVGIAREHGPDVVLDRFLRTLNGSKELIEISDDYVIRSESERIKTLEQLLEASDVDIDQFDIERYIVNKYDQHSVEKGLVELFQVKAWLKKKYLDKPNMDYYRNWVNDLHIDHSTFDIAHNPEKPIVVAIADLHIGAFIEGNTLHKDYNIEVCRQKLAYIAGILSQQQRPVVIKFLGDYIESFSGKNHKDTWKQIEMHGMEVALLAFDVIREFLDQIYGLVEVDMVSGNHDRVSADNEEDKQGQVGFLISELLDRFTNVPVTYHSDIITKVHDDVCYIMSHGHKRFSKMLPSEMVMNYGDQNLFNVMITGHGHQEKILHNSIKYQCRQIPAIIPANDYAKSLGASSMQGFTIFERNNFTNQVNVFTYSV